MRLSFGLPAALAVALCASGQTFLTLSPTTSPSAGQPGVTVITITGSNFPAGTILPANVDVTLQPTGGGPLVGTKASSVTTVVGTTRRVAFQIPSGILVSSPTAYQASISGVSAAGLVFLSSNKALFTINPGSGATLAPNWSRAGQTLAVSITGIFTNFVQGSTQASFGPGISVGGAGVGGFGSVTVTSSTTATAQLTINASAAGGPRDVTVRTGTQQITLPGGFRLNLPPTVNAGPDLTVTLPNPASLNGSVTDDGLPPGTPLTITWSKVSGPGAVTFANANAAVTTATFSQAGEYVLQLTATDSLAPADDKVGVTAGTAPLSVITSVNPNTGQQGQQNLPVTINGQNTHFVQGTTTASFGAGITVASLTVNAATSATAVINIDSAAALGARNVALTTNTEVAPLANGFTVTEGAPMISITSPVNLSYLNITPTTVNGTVGNPAATVTVNGLTAPVANGMFSLALPLAEGPNVITATAITSGGTGTASIQVTLDTTPPRVTITSPPDQFVTTDASISVAGNVNDIVVGTVNDQQAQVTVNGVAAQVSNRTFLAVSAPLAIGANVVQAVGRDRTGNAGTTQITVTRQPPSPSQIRLISGNNQTGPIGSALSAPLVVSLTDASGNPVPNKPVIFKVTQNNGMVSAGAAPGPSIIATTNAQGQAQAQWTLGTRAGAGGNAVEAYAVGYGGTAIFTATGTQGPAGLVVIDTGNNQIGAVNQPLPKPLIAVVVDSGNNRLANVPVTFTVKQGGGSFNGQPSLTANTDSDGRAAAVLTLGFQEGNSNNLIEANFPNNQGFPASFTASGRAAGNPANTTITGVVLDNSNVPIPGVTIRAVLSHLLTSNSSIINSVAAVPTNTQGQFTIPQAPVGFVKLLADGSTAQRPGKYPTLDYDMVTVAGQTNTVGAPIFLLPLSAANQLCVTATTGGGTLTIPEAPGFSLTFGPGQVTFPGGSKDGCVSVTVVHPDKVPMTPGFGQQPRFIVTIQPAGALFNPPAPITLPNVDGLNPRAVTEMYSFDHDIGSFVAIGTGTVSEDGQLIRSNQGVGVLKAGWHCGGNPQARGTVADCWPCTFCQGGGIFGDSCVPDPSQIDQSCTGRSTHNVCVTGGLCGKDTSFNPPRPTGQCVGGTNLPNGTACQSGGSAAAQCIDGRCICVGPQCPVNCDDGNACTLDYGVNGVCVHPTNPDCQFCAGQPSGTPCGICRTGATCNGGLCSGGTPSTGSCGPCMTGGICSANGQCIGGSPVADNTPCGNAGLCRSGTCEQPPLPVGILTALDDFPGRSTTKFGVAETVRLSFSSSPPRTAAQFGGLAWTIVSGGGTLTASSDGIGTYTAPPQASTVTLKLAILSGPLQGQGPTYNLTIVEPASDSHMVQQPGTGVDHCKDTAYIGILAHVYLMPKDVSFGNIQFREGEALANGTGYYSFANNAPHCARPGACDFHNVSGGNAMTGSRVQFADLVKTGESDTQPFSNGRFTWNIPWLYRAGTFEKPFVPAVRHEASLTATSSSQGTVCISKDGIAPICVATTDVSSSFLPGTPPPNCSPVPSDLRVIETKVANDGTSGFFKYQVLDQDGRNLAVAGMSPLETVQSLELAFRELNSGDEILRLSYGSTPTQPFGDPTDSAGQFVDPKVGFKDLADFRRQRSVDFSVTGVTIKTYSIMRNGVTFAPLGTFKQTVCQTATDVNGTISVGNCGVSQVRQ